MRYSKWMIGVLTVLCVALAAPAALAQDLTVWVQSDVRREQFAAIIDWYKQENPSVSIDLQLISGGQAEFTEKLSLAIASGAPPDLTWLEGSTVIELAAQGLLADVTRALEGIRFTPSDTEEMTFQGKMYGVPYHTTSRGLLKRVDLFNEAGLDPTQDPASLDELWNWNQRLTVQNNDGSYSRVGIIPWGSNWGAPAWIWSFGGELLDESKTRPTATLPNNIRAFEWIQEWAQSYGHQTPVQGGYTGFLNGTVAMVAESTSSTGRLLGEGVELIAGRVPHAPGGANGTWGGGQALGIPSNAANQEGAMKLLRYFGSEEVQVRRFEQFPEAFPANWDALMRIAPTLPPAYGALLDQLPEARPRTPLWIDYYVRNLRPQVTAVVNGQTSPREALQTIQQVMEARFAEVFGQ